MRLRTALLTLALAATLGAAPVSAQPQAQPHGQHPSVQRSDDNPLAGRTWGVYQGKADQAWEPYTRATGKRKKLLAKIALRPKAKWYGAWIPDRDIEATIRKHVAAATGGDPETLFSAAVFRMVPWEHPACDRLPTRAEQKSYKAWIRGFARGIGATHAMLVLQPDGPFALCAPRDSPVPAQLIRYAARKLAKLPHASVYIDAGSYGDSYTGGYIVQTSVYQAPDNTQTWTMQQIADQLTMGYWGGSTRSYNVGSDGSISVNLTGLDATYRAMALQALQTWTDATGIRFVETTGSAEITFTETGSMTAATSSSRSGSTLHGPTRLHTPHL